LLAGGSEGRKGRHTMRRIRRNTMQARIFAKSMFVHKVYFKIKFVSYVNVIIRDKILIWSTHQQNEPNKSRRSGAGGLETHEEA
jgi:hypothetical protein